MLSPTEDAGPSSRTSSPLGVILRVDVNVRWEPTFTTLLLLGFMKDDVVVSFASIVIPGWY